MFTSQQFATLNALVTFAAENIPGGLSESEREVAQIVGRWVLLGPQRTHDYDVVNVSHYKDAREAANLCAERGWRVVGVIPSKGQGYAEALMLERPVEVSHPDD